MTESSEFIPNVGKNGGISDLSLNFNYLKFTCSFHIISSVFLELIRVPVYSCP